MKKVRKTQLDDLAVRETTTNIEIGNLLLKSRKLLAHGEWKRWLHVNFDLTYRTAVNYCKAAEYVAGKSETVAHFLAPGVLYNLAAGNFYTAAEEAAILGATRRKKRVDATSAAAICQALKPRVDEVAADIDDAGAAQDAADAADAEDAESILDGPPPAVPPPAPIAPPDYVRRGFDEAVNTLKLLMTKPAAQFAGTVHDAGDLEKVEGFIHAVRDRVRKSAGASVSGSVEEEAQTTTRHLSGALLAFSGSAN